MRPSGALPLAAALLALSLAPLATGQDPAPAGYGRTPCDQLGGSVACVDAWASASHVCTPAGNCWYSLRGGARACAFSGGEVALESPELEDRSAPVEAGGCNSVESARVDTIQCARVQGVLTYPLGRQLDYAAACAAPLGI